MEGSWSQDIDDRYAHCSAVVHLRLCEGLLPVAPPTSPRDAREPKEKTRGKEAAILDSSNYTEINYSSSCTHTIRNISVDMLSGLMSSVSNKLFMDSQQCCTNIMKVLGYSRVLMAAAKSFNIVRQRNRQRGTWKHPVPKIRQKIKVLLIIIITRDILVTFVWSSLHCLVDLAFSSEVTKPLPMGGV